MFMVHGNIPEKVIPRFINLLRDGKKLPYRGDGCNIAQFHLC